MPDNYTEQKLELSFAAKFLVADSIRRNLTVVPVCPLFARHLKAHGDEFVAAGGAFRRPNRDDVALVTRVARARRDDT